ncbi:hypothetical protein [Arthrobacter woluwensis]|uniref:hypothetical protein n=1 Tax=Arthrobacter woluwensis TaxID=156980 RepID=UPI00381927E1
MSQEMKSLRVEEFIMIRAAVASQLGQNSQTQAATRERQAEHLMALGYIDFEAVLRDIASPERPIEGQSENGEERA